MEKLLKLAKRIQLLRIGQNVFFIFILVNMAYNNFQYTEMDKHMNSIAFILHQIGGTIFFFVGVYAIIFIFTTKYLFNNKYGLFFFFTIFSLSAIAAILALQHQFVQNNFSRIQEFLLVPISLDGNAADGSWFLLFQQIFQKGVFVYLFLIFPYLARRYFIEKKEKEILLYKQNEMELSQLKSQINPHFLFNVLNSIYALALKKSDKTPDIVLRLSDLLRFILYESKDASIPLSKEVQLLSDYIEIEKIRINDSNIIIFEVDGDLSPYKITPLILLPFVENAIKHGIDSMIMYGRLAIRIKIEKNTLHFICSNTYKAKNGSTTLGGIGIANVKKRLEILYPNGHQMDIHKDNDEFDVTLIVNL